MFRYGQEKGVDAGKWHLLTGNKGELYKLARQSYFVLKPAEAQNLGDGESDFIHTNNFVLIDRERRIRGYYDGTDSLEVGQLIKDIGVLLEEK
jgi:protein SCO1/2